MTHSTPVLRQQCLWLGVVHRARTDECVRPYDVGREPFTLRTLFCKANLDCPFWRGMLGSKRVASAYANPVKPNSSVPGRLAHWLQSASADVWVKFLLALVGLGLAFGAALFSTVSRDAG